MQYRWIREFRWMRTGAWVAVMLSLCGCDDDRYDHTPPEGLGAVIVENNTRDRLRVYIDGTEVDRVKDWKHRTYDCEPGVRRVTLDGDSAGVSWAGDIDVLEGRLTVLEVYPPYGNSRILDVRYFFD